MKVSHTLVRNGQPFIDLVLRQVEPFMDKMFITVSEKSDDGTMEVVEKIKKDFKKKVILNTENVTHPGELTYERQKQLDNTPKNAWVLFLDGDDYWPYTDLKLADMFLTSDVDGLAVNPFQLVDKEMYDYSWRNKWFTKWFKNSKGVHYRHPWPRDLIYKNDDVLYWRKNERVPRVALKYFHLSNLMDWRFRDEEWAKEYKTSIGVLKKLDLSWDPDIEKIYDCIR